MYFSASAAEVTRLAALLLKPSASSSSAKFWAGLVSSPSRSRTVLLYSKRVMRRTGALPGCGLVQVAAGAAGMVGEPGELVVGSGSGPGCEQSPLPHVSSPTQPAQNSAARQHAR